MTVLQSIGSRGNQLWYICIYQQLKSFRNRYKPVYPNYRIKNIKFTTHKREALHGIYGENSIFVDDII